MERLNSQSTPHSKDYVLSIYKEVKELFLEKIKFEIDNKERELRAKNLRIDNSEREAEGVTPSSTTDQDTESAGSLIDG